MNRFYGNKTCVDSVMKLLLLFSCVFSYSRKESNEIFYKKIDNEIQLDDEDIFEGSGSGTPLEQYGELNVIKIFKVTLIKCVWFIDIFPP